MSLVRETSRLRSSRQLELRGKESPCSVPHLRDVVLKAFKRMLDLSRPATRDYRAKLQENKDQGGEFMGLRHSLNPVSSDKGVV